MAQKTRIGGTSFEITGGKGLIGGAVYRISGGKTLVNGTAYDILFSNFDPVFANNDWAAIIAACQSGSVPESWAVGDAKVMTINGADYQIDIIGKNHDTYADGGTAPLTFQLHDCYEKMYAMNAESTNDGGWTNCKMRNTYLPAIKVLMPVEVQAALRKVNKKTSAGNMSNIINTTNDDLFLLSEIEIYGITIYSFSGEGNHYAYYRDGGMRTKMVLGEASVWGERSPHSGSDASFCRVNANGDPTFYSARWGRGVSFAFCF